MTSHPVGQEGHCFLVVNKQTISMGSRVTPPEPKLRIRKQVEAIKE